MATEEFKIVQETWEKARGLGLDNVSKLFYGTMFTDFPELPLTIFRGVNMDEQRPKLMAMLDSAVNLLSTPDQLIPVLQESGIKHAGYGCEERHYPMVGQSLLKTLEAGLGDAFTPAVRNAWVNVYAIMQKTMVDAQNTPEGKKLFAEYKRRQEQQTARDFKIVQETWEKVRGLGLENVGKLFYGTMFKDFPELPETLFRGVNMDEQRPKLMAMLDSAVNLLATPDQLIPVLQESGIKHAGYGCEERHYPMVGQSLIKTLEAGLGAAFTPSVRNAWLNVYGIMQTTMVNAQNTPEGQKLYAAYCRRHGVPAAGAATATAAPSAAPEKLPEYVLEDVENVTHNTKRFTFRTADGKALPLPPGGHMCIIAKGLSRNYTPYKVYDDGRFDIIIKHYEKGPMSTYMHGLEVGQKVTMTGPKPPHCPAVDPEDPKKHLLLVGAGTGIAPIYSMAHSLASEKGVQVTMLCCYRDRADVLLGEQLVAVNAAHIRRVWNLSREKDLAAVQQHYPNDKVIIGRLSEENISSLGLGGVDKAVLCGPTGFNVNAKAVLNKALSLPRENIGTL